MEREGKKGGGEEGRRRKRWRGKGEKVTIEARKEEGRGGKQLEYKEERAGKRHSPTSYYWSAYTQCRGNRLVTVIGVCHSLSSVR